MGGFIVSSEGNPKFLLTMGGPASQAPAGFWSPHTHWAWAEQLLGPASATLGGKREILAKFFLVARGVLEPQAFAYMGRR